MNFFVNRTLLAWCILNRGVCYCPLTPPWCLVVHCTQILTFPFCVFRVLLSEGQILVFSTEVSFHGGTLERTTEPKCLTLYLYFVHTTHTCHIWTKHYAGSNPPVLCRSGRSHTRFSVCLCVCVYTVSYADWTSAVCLVFPSGICEGVWQNLRRCVNSPTDKGYLFLYIISGLICWATDNDGRFKLGRTSAGGARPHN